MKAGLSVALITMNEEANLSACLESVSFADDIVVVDSGSTDGTVEIASKTGARVFVEEWKGFGPQKMSAVKKCRHEWVLVIDADERIPDNTREDILNIIKDQKADDAYSFPRKNLFHGRWIKRCGWWPDRVVRLVRKDKGRFESVTHEKWVTSGNVNHSLMRHIEHRSFRDYSDMLERLNKYSSAIASEALKEGKKSGAFRAFTSGVWMFIKIYFIQLGFLEGLDGLVIALTKAGGSFFKYAKLIEMKRHYR